MLDLDEAANVSLCPDELQNMLDHEDEIRARPQRTWFQSERQKKDLKRKAASTDFDDSENLQVKSNSYQEEIMVDSSMLSTASYPVFTLVAGLVVGGK